MSNYRAFSVTCHGAKYKDKGMPCQDHSNHDTTESVAMAIVADGHGSSRCFRSHIGSEKAVKATENCLKNWLASNKVLSKDPEDFKDKIHSVIKQIINKWFAEVMEHAEENPLSKDSKIEEIEQKYRDRYEGNDPNYNEDYYCHAYGTTLMAAIMTDEFWFAFQIGDGKCVVLYDDGTWALPIPWDDNCSFNTTTSICDDNSLGKFRYWFGWRNDDDGDYEEYGYGIDSKGKVFENKPAKLPLAIFIGTDGVEDSYPRVDNDKYVINFYRNRVVTLAKGFTGFDEEIKGFAERFAERESTDDVSIAGIVGDLSDKGKSAIISRMKFESANHETNELLTVKKRDMEEKYDSLEFLKNQAGVKINDEKKIEDDIAKLEKEIKQFENKKKVFENTLAKAKSDSSESEKFLGELQTKRVALEKKCKEIENEEQKKTTEFNTVKGGLRIANANLSKLESEYSRKRASFINKQKKSSELLSQLNEIPSQPNEIRNPALNNMQKAIVEEFHTKGQIKLPIEFIKNAISNIVVITNDDLASELKKVSIEIQRLENALQNLQARVSEANRNRETINRKIEQLNQNLRDLQQNKVPIEAELEIVQRNHEATARQNAQHCDDVKQNELEIKETEKQILSKQSDIDKLKKKLEVLKEQNKVQSERISTLETAYETAKKEVEELEKSIQK